MAGSHAFNLVKTVIIPLIVAAVLYLVLSFVLLPFYRRYRADIARYSQYAPLTSTLQSTTSIFGDYIPESLRPRSIRERSGDFLMRTVLPCVWAIRNRRRNVPDDDVNGRESTSDEDGGLFDEESGERMVGFDMNEGGRRGNNRRRDDRYRTRGVSEDETMSGTPRESHTRQDEHSDRRLSRELEEGFRDDSESEASDEGVTVGRRRLSMAGNRFMFCVGGLLFA